MATSSASSESDRIPASCVYRLADAVVRFRYYAELNYAGADDTIDFGGGPPVVPRVIETSYGNVLDSALRTADTLPVVADDAQVLIAAALSMRNHIGQIWLNADHCRLLRDRRSAAAESDGLNNGYCDWLLLSRSALAPSAWADYQAAADRLQSNLPGVCGPLFRLSLLLAGISYPLLSGYDDDLGTNPVFDTDRLLMELGPKIVELVRAVRAGSGLLDGVEERLNGKAPYQSANALHKRVRRVLSSNGGRCSGEGVTRTMQSSGVPAAVKPNSLPPADTGASGGMRNAGPDEDVVALLALKRRMDPNDDYVGQSTAVLRLFREMELLNRLPDDPVMILGPSGAGKTRLARLMHKTSTRGCGQFLDLSADDLVGGDETIRRVRWAGHGRDSGLPNIDPKKAAAGWLQEAKGGTIFVDEFHNLDEVSLNYLRKPLDRDRLIPLAVGVGESFKPDVRLIFATYRAVEDLRREGKIPPDVLRRLRNRFLSVPPLRERKDDIPLFVEKFRGNRRPGECFYLALLYHDWGQGQVDELITAIRTAVANNGNQGTLRASDLRRVVPDEVVTRVTGMAEADVGRELYLFLTRTLEAQGFRRGNRRGVALQQRLAELLGVDKARVSSRIRELGLRPGDGTPDG